MGRIVVYPGNFDPITFGHLDLIKRATHIFDEVIVAVVKQSSKNPTFSVEERVKMIKQVTEKMPKVRVESFDGLVVDFARKNNAKVILRGLRMISDFDYEFQMAFTNRRLNEQVETVFLMPSAEYTYLSSSMLKESAALGADISPFVPDFIGKQLKERLRA